MHMISMLKNHTSCMLLSSCIVLLTKDCIGDDPRPPITPNFPSGSSREIIGYYVENKMLAHHFSHYYNWRC